MSSTSYGITSPAPKDGHHATWRWKVVQRESVFLLIVYTSWGWKLGNYAHHRTLCKEEYHDGVISNQVVSKPKGNLGPFYVPRTITELRVRHPSCNWYILQFDQLHAYLYIIWGFRRCRFQYKESGTAIAPQHTLLSGRTR